MDVLEAIFNRRSIRSYTGETVSPEELHTVLRAGFYAPSAHYHQPTNFLVIQDPETLQAIAEEHPYAKMLPQAGCAVLVCGNLTRQTTEGFLVADCSAATQNMLLAATGLGLGTVWCGVYPKKDLMDLMRTRFALPDPILPIAIMALGHSAEQRSVPERFDPRRVHFETWQA